MYRRSRLALASLPALAVLVIGAFAYAQVGGTVVVPYQGRLEHNGELVFGSRSITFRFFDAPTGGTLLDDASHAVDVHQGLFAVDIGPVSRSVLDASSVYLELEVEGAVLASRQLLRAAPYAVQGQAGGPFVAQNAAVGAVGPSGDFAAFAHRELAGGATTYGLAQNTTGETLVNAEPGGSVKVRVGNVDRLTVDGSGTVTASGAFAVGTTRIENLTVSTHTTTAQLPITDPLTSKQGTVVLGAVAGSFCALTHHRVYFAPNVGSGVQGLEDAYCSLYEDSGNWVLQAHAARSFPFDHLGVDCEARCLRWDS